MDKLSEFLCLCQLICWRVGAHNVGEDLSNPAKDPCQNSVTGVTLSRTSRHYRSKLGCSDTIVHHNHIVPKLTPFMRVTVLKGTKYLLANTLSEKVGILSTKVEHIDDFMVPCFAFPPHFLLSVTNRVSSIFPALDFGPLSANDF